MSSRKSGSVELQPKWATLAQWGRLTGFSRSTTYRWLALGKLHAKKDEKTVRIDVEHGLAAIAALPDAKINLPAYRKAASGDESAPSTP